MLANSVSEKRRGQINYFHSLSSSSPIYDSTVTNLLKTKRVTSPLSLNHAFSEPGWMWRFLCLMIYSLRGVGRDRKAKEEERGVETDGSTWGYGDGQLSSIPQGIACYAKQNQSFSKMLGLICQPQQTHSISPPPTVHPLFTVGAFLLIHRGMETTVLPRFKSPQLYYTVFSHHNM